MGVDLTTQVLIEIRDEIRNVRDEARNTNARLDQTNERLDRLERRQTQTELRLATELVAVRDAVQQVVSLYRQDRALRDDVDDLKTRVSDLERKAG